MPLVPISLPPGVWRNGTQYQSKGRWFDANLTRFFDGTLRPIGGWQSFSGTAVSGMARAIITWSDGSGKVWVVFGTTNRVFVYDLAGAQNDITPSGLASGNIDASFAAGYGAGAYGSGGYGTTRGGSTILVPATVWTFDVLEQYLVGTNEEDGKIYQWDLSTSDIMTQCAGSPTGCKAVFVTQEGFIFALGAGGDPRNIQWPDQESFTDWTPSDINQAGSYSLQTVGQVMCGRRIKDASLIFTTTDLHVATYIGLPGLYSFDMVATNCGIISRQAHAAGEGICAWMGPNGFWQYNGVVQAIECDVADYVFGRLNRVQASKVFAVHNGTYGEITWFYPSTLGLEVDSNVTWNYREGHWNIGAIVRTCGAEGSVVSTPLMTDNTGQIWAHEVGNTYSGVDPPFAETGPLEMGKGYLGDQLAGAGEGANVFDIVGLFPDQLTLGDVTGMLFSRFYPLGDETSFGPFAMANPTNLRVAGREFRLRVTFTDDGRVGIPRLDVRLSGQR